MLADIGLLLLGGIGLYFGAEWLVAGAARLALTLGVPPLVIGLTIVSYGTSAPELVVSVVAALEDKSAIAFGNVVGSNIANVGLILGITALIAPPRIDPRLRRRELPLLLIASATLPLVFLDGEMGRIEGAIFFAAAIAYTFVTFRRGEPTEEAEVPGGGRPALLFVLIIVGLGVLVGGGQAFVHGATGIARTLGMSDRLVGLTIVAVGTSLPELAASLVAALRGHSELAVGNVVGSNLFNVLLVLGAASLVHPIQVDLRAAVFDVSFMEAITVACAISLWRERTLTRAEGAAYAGAYVAFLVGLALVH
jgi:cation:H+ antiporter